jgi:ERCC4-related helicase
MAHNPALTLMIKRFNVLDNEYNQTVQSIIEKLKVSHIELRSDESIDIQQYNHTRKVDLHVLKLEDDMLKIKNAFLNVRCVLSVLFVQL